MPPRLANSIDRPGEGNQRARNVKQLRRSPGSSAENSTISSGQR